MECRALDGATYGSDVVWPILRDLCVHIGRRHHAMTKSLKVRHCLYFEPKVSEQLEALTAEPGTSMSDLVNGAVIAHLKQRGASQIERSSNLYWIS